ncbi:hypothetical protein pb186bvf_005672 [Paramecium bursaria]
MDIENQHGNYHDYHRQLQVRIFETIEVLVVGESQTGKSQLTRLLAQKDFQKHLLGQKQVQIKTVEKTKGCDYRIAFRQYNEACKLKFLDVSGDKTQRNYLDIYLSQCQQVDIVIFCFDATNLKTFSNLNKWIKLLYSKKQQQESAVTIQRSDSISLLEENNSIKLYQEYTGLFNNKTSQPQFLIVGCKMDLISRDKAAIVRQQISRTLGKLFMSGENLFLVSTTKIQNYISEYEFLEQCFEKVFKGEANFTLKLNEVSILDRHEGPNNPIYRYFHLINVYAKLFCLRLICKKQKK